MKISIAILVTVSFSMASYAQGCSDAGFCSLGILKSNLPSANKRNSLAIGVNYGAGEQNTSTINPYLEYGVKANARFSFQAKITSTYATGFLGSTFNVGDLYGFASYTPSSQKRNRLSILSGIKVPLSRANDKNEEGKPLPLDYQSSVGTFDIIEGISYTVNDKWVFNAGVQIPVIQRNRNTFFPDEFADGRINKFLPTNNFRRKSDAMFRLGRYVSLKQASIKLEPNILAIYHLGKDSYENRLGKRESIAGSDGLTMNAGVIATKTFKTGSQLEAIAAAPFIVRDARPDGLTRRLVLNLQYRFHF